MFRLLLCTLVLLTPWPALAQDDGDNDSEGNPFLDTPPRELRQRLANVEPVFEQDWYRVEALIFARTRPITEEFWRLEPEPELVPNPIRPAFREDAEPVLPEEADDIDRVAADQYAWRALEKDERLLKDMAERMEDRGGYRILFHQSWHQPVRERNRAFPVRVQGGELLASPSSLSFAPDEDAEPEQAPADDRPEPAPTPEEPAEESESLVLDSFLVPEMRGDLRLHLSRYLHVEPNLWFTDEAQNGERFHVQISQHRRMRSEELHYIDHPLFGLLLYLEPWKTPEQEKIEQMEEALEQQMERDDS